ncbi:MAG: hypothetical protein Q8O03_03585 [Nanoarchaeota archaeon]|nr:hypothetical protein [Nanoarchaeota archaeon]
MKIEELIYHPTWVKISYKVYEISVALGFAVMPKLPKDYTIEKKLEPKNIDDITKSLKGF